MIKNKPFYGWFTLTGAVLVTFLIGGVFVNTFGVFLPVFCDKFGWSRAEVSMALSLGMLAFGLPSIVFSTMVSKYGPRFTMLAGNLLAAVGVASLFFVKEIWQLYMAYIFTGATAGFGGYIACTTLANNWFVKKRALAMGVITAATGVGGLFFPPVTTALINAVGWQETWLILAGIVAVTAVLAGGIMVRNRPEDMGQLPDGDTVPATYTLPEQELKPVTAAKWSLTSILKMRTTYLIMGFIIANAFVMGTVNAHQIAYFKDVGFNEMTAAATMSVLSILSLTGSLGFGALALKINMRYLVMSALASQLIGIIILLTTKNLTMMFVYSGFMGLGVGALFAAMPSFLGAYYPRAQFANVTGLIMTFYVSAQAVAAWLMGAIHDATGKYVLAFLILGIFCLVGGICTYFVRQPKNIQ
jgi:MFS family permease